MMNYTYILLCENGACYTGWTTDPVHRFHEHRSGRGARYTRMNRPVRIVYLESFADKKDAMRREWQIKHMSRKEKERLFKSSIEKQQ